MSKGILTKNNSSWGIIVNQVAANEFRHSISFPDENLKDIFIAKFLFGDENFNWKAEIEKQPEFAFIRNSAQSGVFTIRVSDYPNENIDSLLNKDTAMVLTENGEYLTFALSGATYDGKRNITYVADLDIPFSYNILYKLKNNFSIERTHAKKEVINLDFSQKENNIQTNFLKREMFDTSTKEKIENTNFASIFLFYAIESDSESLPSRNSLYDVKIIPICSGPYYPEEFNGESVNFNSTLNALNSIYAQKDPNLKHIMILPETPWIQKKYEIIDDVKTWKGALSYNEIYIDFELLNNSYVFHIKNDLNFIGEIIFSGIYKLKIDDDSGEFAPKTISFNSLIENKKTYSLDYGIVTIGDDFPHIFYNINGNLFPPIGETKIIFLGGRNDSSTQIANQLNNGDFSQPVLYGNWIGEDENLNSVYVYPIKISNIDNVNYRFETPTGADLYNLYSGTWYYNYSYDGHFVIVIPNNNDFWGKGGGYDDQVILKELDYLNSDLSTNQNFIYRFPLKNFIKTDEDLFLFQGGKKDLYVGIPNTDFNLKIPINLLTNEYLYFLASLDLSTMTCFYFLEMENYNVNNYQSNFIISDVQISGPTISSEYLEWYNSHKTSRFLGRIETSILLAGGATSLIFSPFHRAFGFLGAGLIGGGLMKGGHMIANRKNMERMPAKNTQGEDVFFNFLQPNLNLQNVILEEKLANFDFSLYIWEQIPEDNFQENERKNLITSGIQVSNLVNNVFAFGEKKRFQYFEIKQTFENIDLPLSAEIKQQINDIFEQGITFWFFREDLVFEGIKNYEQENPFIDEEIIDAKEKK